MTQIFSTKQAFAALKSDGSVVTWGDSRYGGDKSIYDPTTQTYTSVSSHLTEVTQIFSTQLAFAALKNDGSVVTWGDISYGGNGPAEVTATSPKDSDKVIGFANTLTNEIFHAPTITSGTTGIDLVENSGEGQPVYEITADANDGGNISSYAIGGEDEDDLSVNANSGVVTLDADPDYETKNSYSFTVTATDAAGTSAAKDVTFSIINVDATAPTITSGNTRTNLVENIGAGQTVYEITADANDGVAISSYEIAGTDAAKLSVNANSGVVTLTENPDYETQPSYSFTVTAKNATGTSAATTVTFSITNVDDIVPTITSGATGTYLVENSGVGQTVYTITADANDGGTISSYAIAGTDAALLSVNAASGVVTLTANPDYEI